MKKEKDFMKNQLSLLATLTISGAFLSIFCIPDFATAQESDQKTSVQVEQSPGVHPGVQLDELALEELELTKEEKSSGREPASRKSRFRSGNEVRTRRSPKRRIIYKKRNVVRFDDSLIEGEVQNPSEFYFVHREQERFGTLIKKRKNFHKEMLRDTVMLR